MKAFGLTGNIGCGKSTVAKMLSELPDVIVFDCDLMAKELLGELAYQEQIIAIVGPECFYQGRPDFAKMSQVIFTDPDKKKQLEALLHPLVWQSIEKTMATLGEGMIYVVESAIIYETNWQDRFAATVVVSCKPEEQIRRLQQDRAMNLADIQARLAQQLNASEKERRADIIIDTNCSFNELRQRTQDLYNQLRQLSRTNQKTRRTIMKKAVYAGTFDPPTLGHQWMIEQAAELFDEVVVAIAVNPNKKTMFPVEERLVMLRAMTAGLKNVSVAAFDDAKFLARYAESIGANILLRDIRAGDYDYEKVMRNVNAELCPQITTIFLIPPNTVAEISSSMVKALIGPEGWEKLVAHYVPVPVLKRLLMAKHTIWKHLQEAGAMGDAEWFWETILEPYFGKDRAYHNWAHICDLLTEFAKVRDFAYDPLALEMAIWCHDIVHDTHRRDNEEESAKLARRIIKALHLPDKLGQEVDRLIMCTKHNQVPVGQDAKMLADLDLLIFAKPEAEIDEYEAGIEKEYGWAPWTAFVAKRLEVLDGIKANGVYTSDLFREKYEAIAKDNIARLIEKIRARA